MSTNHEHNGEDELHVARRTAHALGETAGAERAAIEGELSASPQARQEAAEVELLAARLKQSAQAAGLPEHSLELREAVERRLRELEPAELKPAARPAAKRTARPWWRRHMAALALAAACLVVLAVPIARSLTLFGSGQPRQVAKVGAATGAAAPESARSASQSKAIMADSEMVDKRPQDRTRYNINKIEDAPTFELMSDPMPSKAATPPPVAAGPTVTPVLTGANKYSGSTAHTGEIAKAGGLPSTVEGNLNQNYYTREIAKNDVVTKMDEDYGAPSSHIGQIVNDNEAMRAQMNEDYGDRKGGGGEGGGRGDLRVMQSSSGTNDTGGGFAANGAIVAGVTLTHSSSGTYGWPSAPEKVDLTPDQARALGKVHAAGDVIDITNGALIVTSSGFGYVPSEASNTFSGAISGSPGTGALTKVGSGVLTLNSSRPFSDYSRPSGYSPWMSLNGGATLGQVQNGQVVTGGLATNGGTLQTGSGGPQGLSLTGANGLQNAGQGQADFQPLKDLVNNTGAQKSWLDNGGAGTLSDFPTNLSLSIVSNSGSTTVSGGTLEVARAEIFNDKIARHPSEMPRGALAKKSGLSPDARRSLENAEMLATNDALVHDEVEVKQLMDRFDSLMAEGRHKLQEESGRDATVAGSPGNSPSGNERSVEDTLSRIRRLREELEKSSSSLTPTAKNVVVLARARNELARLEATMKSNDSAGHREKMLASAGGKQNVKPPQKPVESWKPARVVPNASRLMVGDKEELPLKGMQVDVRVDGFRARVLVDLYYLNDRPQQLEGNFQLRLPEEAAPYFFAFGRTVYQAPQVTAGDSMFFKPAQVSLGDTTPEKILALRGNSWEQPKVARMVPKEKAAMAYRDTVRRRIDPALVEWSGAGVFQCRVFPLAAQSLHRITIGYDVDLVRVGDDLELRLDLPEWQSRAGAPATVVDLNVSAADARQVSLDASATQSPDGRRLSYRLVDPKDRPLIMRLRKPGTQMLTGVDGVDGNVSTGNYFATRVALPVPEVAAGDRAKQAVFLVDTSLSAGPQFPLWTKMLQATLDNNRDQIKQFAVLFFNVETFWWQEKYVDNTPENVATLVNYADNLALEGATDLGRALKEAAAPRWQKANSATPPDMFLLSDGAATWGEDRWPLLAAGLNAKTNSKAGQPGKPDVRSALFAYHTGLAGGDARLLGYLAAETGGAVFSLVGEAEIAPASVAHRNRPWRLTNIEMAGSHDLLVAGRPQYVFPGQQLTIVGRLETALTPGPSPAAGEGSIVFTLQQGTATQTIKVPMEQVIASELAGRTFGQVATNQLEDVSGVDQSAEPVATAYARHFRVTGRTCSLLMLESEQDYARFNIKPEEDSFVVKERPVEKIVSKAIADTVAAMSDPKASFLAWYGRLGQSSEVHFDLPASLKVFIDSLPADAFAVDPSPLVCKLRLRHELPENLRQPWQSGMPDYETLDTEAQRRLTAYGADDALRCLSSLVEERPGDAGLARDLAFTAIDWQRPGEAYHLLRRAANARTFEPITFHAMAHCLEQMASSDNHAADLAIIYYELACGGQWDARFGDMHNIALLDYARFLRRVVDGRLKSALGGYAESRLASLAAMNLRDTADVATLIFWNTDGTDVDLHVIEPSSEECYYGHSQTASGGHISRDVTTGYGPELYLLPHAPAGRYDISAHYFATDANRATTRTKVLAFIYENWGAADERVVVKSLALTGRSEKHELGVVKR